MSQSRQLWSVLGNSQKLDGGAMFGNAPRSLWSRWIAPDELNRIPLACRCLLIQEEDGRLILCEAGIGAFFPPKLKERFGIQESQHCLLDNLAQLGFKPQEIDVIVLSHLHFDHAGGLLNSYDPHSEPSLCFPNAHYVIGQEAWERALHPHPRDRASFIDELIPLLEATHRVELVPPPSAHSSTDPTSISPPPFSQSQVLGPEYRFYSSYGHTPGQVHLEIPSENGPIVFCGDLIPGAPWVHLPITMGYDRFPEQLIDEKRILLEYLLTQKGRLFFTHDSQTALATFSMNERKRYQVQEEWSHLEGFEI